MMATRGSNQSVTIQALSLYVLLLAFFLALTRISATDQDRLGVVSGSLNSTFRAEGRPAREPSTFTASLGDALASPAFLDQVGELVRTELALSTVREIVPGALMELAVADSALFAAGDTAIDPLYRRVLERVAASLADPAPGVRYGVEIAIGTATGTSAADPALRLAVARAAVLAAVLGAAGAPPHTLAAGVEAGAPGRVRMLFHVRPAAEPRPPFAPEPDGR